MKHHACVLVAALLLVGGQSPAAPAKPNIILIMADDLGFSDLGCYGGEIRTPNLDALAKEGIRHTRFTNTSRCCPSRASLMTGRYPHSVEMGWMTAVDEHRSGYRNELSEKFPTIAELLKSAGYSTYLSGKWHLTHDTNDKAPNSSWPTRRGFDEFYGIIRGDGGFYKPDSLARNLEHIPASGLPEDFYLTHAITDHAVEFLEAHPADQPFFLYLAHYAPHRPLEAPENRIAPYRQIYEKGYDTLYEERFERLIESGVLTAGAKRAPFGDGKGVLPPWDELSTEDRKAWIEEMATYAAMVDIMDEGIGKVLETVRKKGVHDNTLVLFLSDNGATAEGGKTSQLAATLSNTPYPGYKQFTQLGGVASPLIVHWPARLDGKAGSLVRELTQIQDLPVTLLAAAGTDYPESFRDEKIPPPHGINLMPAWEGGDFTNPPRFYEHQSSRAVEHDGWRLISNNKNQPWKLHNLTDDPFETTDVSASHPEKKRELESLWNQWAETHKVLPLENKPWNQRIQHYQNLPSKKETE